MGEQKFNFNVPVSLIKGDEEGEWRIGGIASTEDKDFQDEIVKIDGLDISSLSKNGFFNQDHKKGFENILGRIKFAEKRENDEIGKHLYVEGSLFKTQAASKAAWNIMNELGPDERKMQMSIEGKIIKREGKDKKVVSKAKVENVALTLNPINSNTFATFLKSFGEENEDVEIATSEDTDSVRVTLKKSTYNRLLDLVDNQKSFKEHLTDLCKGMTVSEVNHVFKVLKKSKEELEKQAEKSLTATHSYSTQLPQERTGGDVMTQESLDRNDKKKKKKETIKQVVLKAKSMFPDNKIEDLVSIAYSRYELLTSKGE